MVLINNPQPTGVKKYAGLDHLRAWAITIVFFFHYRLFDHPEWINNVGNFGWAGVDLFFVLSGFLIASQLFEAISNGKQVQLKEFYIKRFFRIIPVYLFILALYFTVPAFKEREGLSPLWKYLTFTQNFGLDLSKTHAFTHAWSLCIEEQFYLLLPFILWSAIRFKLLKVAAYLLPALFLLGITVRVFSWQHFITPLQGTENFGATWYQYIYYPTYCRLDGLLTGIGIAALFKYQPVIKTALTRHPNLVLTAGLALITTAYFICVDQQSFIASVWGFPLIAVAYGFMVMAAVSPTSLPGKYRSKVTEVIATLSYAIYLSHKAVIHLTQTIFTGFNIPSNSTIMFVLCAINCMLAAYLLHVAIEKPFLHIRNRILQHRI